MDTCVREKRNNLQRLGKKGSLWSFIPNFQMEALGVNVTKYLFSLDLTREVKIENPNNQEDNDLDLDP
jgi:hypothetical protein